jgi:hypothetical protein
MQPLFSFLGGRMKDKLLTLGIIAFLLLWISAGVWQFKDYYYHREKCLKNKEEVEESYVSTIYLACALNK